MRELYQIGISPKLEGCFLKFRSDHVSISSLVKGSFIPKEATSSELRLPCKRRLMSWLVREKSTNSFHFPLLWGSRYRWIHFALRARFKQCYNVSICYTSLVTLRWRHFHRWHKDKVGDFHEHFNKQNTDKQFIKEIEKNGKISFLDCLVTRDNNRLRTTIYRNP